MTASDVAVFRQILDAKDVIEDEADLAGMNVDWTGRFKGESRLALMPRTTEQVADLLRHCQKRKLAVVPQGGNTGLVGGGVPIRDEIIVSLGRMKKVLDHDPVTGTVALEAGVILERADQFVREHGRMMPIDLGAKGSCMIGGCLATNAGGIRVLRYGSLRSNVLGLQAVCADGTVLDNMRGLQKDNTGYDWKQLIVGSEGTLALITAAVIKTWPAPKDIQVALLSLDSYEQIGKLYSLAQSECAEVLSAFEFWDESAKGLLQKHLKLKVPQTSQFAVLIEVSGSEKEPNSEKLLRLLEIAMEKEIILDGSIAQDETQAKVFWSFRESIPEACAKEGLVLKFDLSLGRSQALYSIVERMRDNLKNDATVSSITGYGHFGDGNLHLNISMDQLPDREKVLRIEKQVFGYIRENGGSISAEHGIGQAKMPFLHYSRSDTEIALMYQLKGLFDPSGILNIGKVLSPKTTKYFNVY